MLDLPAASARQDALHIRGVTVDRRHQAVAGLTCEPCKMTPPLVDLWVSLHAAQSLSVYPVNSLLGDLATRINKYVVVGLFLKILFSFNSSLCLGELIVLEASLDAKAFMGLSGAK